MIFMRIINFISGKDLGGPKQSFVLYAESLQGLGHTVVNVIKPKAKLKPLLMALGFNVKEVDYFRTPFWSLNFLARKAMRKVMKPENPELIFIHKPIDIAVVRGALGANVTIVAIIHGFSSKYLEDADELIAVSEKLKEFLIENGIKKKITVIPNMVKISTEPKYRDLPQVPLIGAMGVYRRKKGFHVMIKALAILKHENIKFKAVIAGKGQLYPYYKYLRRSLKLKDELTIRGWVGNEERDEFVDSIDLYVLPSRTETFGMVVIEAMARMKRVIATKCGGPEGIITDGINGYLVEKESPESLARKLKEIISNPEPSNRIAIAANKEAVDNYTIDAISNKLKELIKKHDV
jgi:glycosyltransferase involved in cell wall biosynthesis